MIAEAMKNFQTEKAAAKIPKIIRAYPESKDLKEAVDKVNAIVRQLGEKANADIEADSLKADESSS